jgi:hypothetical protein
MRSVLKTVGLLGVVILSSGDLYGRNPDAKPRARA